MMHIRRVVTLAVVVVAVVSTPAFAAQQTSGMQERAVNVRDTEALVNVVDGVAAGTQPTPTDVSLEWEASHFFKSSTGETYIPFTLRVDPSQLSEGATLYVRAVTKGTTPSAGFPWDDIDYLDVGQDGVIARAMVLAPGEYEVFVAIKERGALDAEDGQRREASPMEAADDQSPPAAGLGLARLDISVPDFAAFSMSSVMIGNIEPLAEPLNEDQQKENPYTFGQMRVTVAAESKLDKAGELQVLFWIYGTEQDGNKPDVTVDYSFHRQTANGEEYFNKTPAQVLNASTLPPQFNVTTDQLPGMLFVPLASFPVGEYRLEILLTDTISGETLTTSANFTVEA
jgi:hypothetical protein